VPVAPEPPPPISKLQGRCIASPRIARLGWPPLGDQVGMRDGVVGNRVLGQLAMMLPLRLKATTALIVVLRLGSSGSEPSEVIK